MEEEAAPLLANPSFVPDFNYKNMMYILDLSYKNLPRHLKACFLYLGSYPEDHAISRVDLVRRWVAEGFVSDTTGQDIWEVAESYFKELVNRSMIQPIYDDTISGIILRCRVHDMLLELIIRRCKEDNFLSLVNDLEAVVEVQDKVIRRLNIVRIQGKKGGENMAGVTLAKIRSLTILEKSNCIPSLLDFKFMRVLSIYGCDQMEIDLNVINHLSQLRYVKVEGCDSELMLPCQIQGLRLLETLDLSHIYGYVSNISLEIDDAPRLSHLIMPDIDLRLPDWIGRIKSLRTSSNVMLPEDSLEGIVGLGELTALSDLSLHFPKCCVGLPSATWMAALSTSLDKLGNLKQLWFYPGSVYWCGDALSSLSPPFLNLEQLGLHGCTFSRVPRWIGCLRSLRDLHLGAKQVLQEDVDVIGKKLPSLISLTLRIPGIPTGRIVIGGSTGFPCLKTFCFDCNGTSFLAFEAGAMPVLWQLRLRLDADGWDKATPVGLHHLPASLEEITILFYIRGNKDDAPLIRSVFQEAVDALPTRPALNVYPAPPRQRREEDDY